MEAIQFIQHLYGESDGYLALWRRDTKATSFVSVGDHKQIEAFVESANESPFNGYFGVCLFGEKPNKGRGEESIVSVVPGVWADIDFAAKDQSDKKSKKRYPSREQAELAIESMPLKPSIVFFTGGGIHAYWLFDRPQLVDDETRGDVKSIVQRWQGRLRTYLMKSCGATLDSTHDLARVMRIPGTMNVKGGNTVEVVVDESFVVDDPPARYSLEAFRDATPAPTKSKPSKPKSQESPSAERIPDRELATVDSNPPADRLANLIEADSKFAQSWANQRSDLSSPSEYDLSLATFAYNAGWKDAEIAALLVAWARRFHPDRVVDKLLRVNGGVQDYLEMTLRSAKRRTFETKQQTDAREAIDQVIDHVDTARERGEPADRTAVFDYVSMILGIKVVGFRQTGERDEVYELIVLQGGKPKAVEIGGADKIHGSPKRLVERLLAVTRTYVALSGDIKKKWGGIVRALFAVVEFVEVGETTTAERVRSLIHEHLTRHRGPMSVANAEQRQAAAVESRPFVEAGELFVSGTALRRLAGEIDKAVVGDLYVGLRSLGFTGRTIQIPLQTTSRSFWAAPASTFGLAAEGAPDLGS